MSDQGYWWVSVVQKEAKLFHGVVIVLANGQISAIVRASAALIGVPTDYTYHCTELPECVCVMPAQFLNSLLSKDEACAVQAWLRPRIAYCDDSKPPRHCDHCNRLYRGPAVYCCLECAEADA